MDRRLSILLLLSLGLYPASLRAQHETANARVQEFAAELEPVLRAAETQTITAADGVRLNVTRFGNQSGPSARPIVISPGMGESVHAYVELARDLLARGYGPIYMLDHRGQGRSERLARNAQTVHVGDFGDYVRDFTNFVEGHVAQDLGQRGIAAKPLLIAHSTGGAIADLALDAKPALFDRVVYLAPMFGVDFHSRILNFAHGATARVVLEVICFVGLCDRVTFRTDTGGGARGIGPDAIRRRYSRDLDAKAGINTTRITARWLREAERASARIRARAQSTGITTLILQAKKDTRVLNPPLMEYACRSNTCSLGEVDSSHAIHQVGGNARAELLNRLDEFLQTGTNDLSPGKNCSDSFRWLYPRPLAQ